MRASGRKLPAFSDILPVPAKYSRDAARFLRKHGNLLAFGELIGHIP
jgi:hypothetical protein